MRLHSDTFQQKKTILEAECRELLETRYQRAMEAVKYELLVKRNDRLRDVSPVRSIKCRLCGCTQSFPRDEPMLRFLWLRPRLLQVLSRSASAEPESYDLDHDESATLRRILART